METIAFIINVIMTLLLARYSLDFNQELKNKIEHIDLAFFNIMEKIKKKEVTPTLDVIATFFGVIALIHFVLFIFSIYASFNERYWIIYLSSVFTYSVFVWMGIKWFTSYEKFSLKFLKDMSMISIYSLSIPAMDYLTNQTGLTESMLNILLLPLNEAGINILSSGTIWIDGLLLALLLEFILLMYWILTSLTLLPIAGSGFIIVAGTIQLSKLLSKISPNRPLSPLVFILWTITAPFGWF